VLWFEATCFGSGVRSESWISPAPGLAASSWLVAVVLAVTAAVNVDGIAIGTAVATALGYALAGAAFGVSACYFRGLLLRRAPTEREVAEGRSLRRFRRLVVLVYLASVTALAFTLWTISGLYQAVHPEHDYAVFMGFLTFILVQSAQGWPWGDLGKRLSWNAPTCSRLDSGSSRYPDCMTEPTETPKKVFVKVDETTTRPRLGVGVEHKGNEAFTERRGHTS
jgi:hypothetical protein